MPRVPPPPALPTSISLLRIVAQGLVPATSAPTPHEAVRRQLAMQGQLFGSSLDAIAARTRQTSTDGVRAAFNHRELMRSWPMRGTIHVTTAEDHHWLRVALDNRRAAFKHRAETEFGVDEKLLKQAADIAFELIGEYGAVSRRTLVNEWARRGVVPADPHAAGAGHLRRSLIIWLHADGLLVQGPLQGNEPLLVDARTLPDATTGPGHSGRGSKARHQPRAVTAADLARWSGLSKTAALRALRDAVSAADSPGASAFDGSHMVPLLRMSGAQLLRMAHAVAGGRQPAEAPAGEFVLRADLADLLAQSLPAARRTMLLPAFDELHIGYQDRSCLTDAAGETLLSPSKNGMFRPMLVDRGRVVAALADGQLVWADGQPASKRLERATQLAINRAARD
ncbi:PF06224 family protein [Propionibacterium freudenreichii]|uniref:DNA glycosylase AlkZ-like family protein n=1 Tax=Propionibacterium freudenreichii TaxID=1744 RepID=UPI000DF02324|nr:crosslink repair DNA glycosylase YcaQ family protein [Propionibacterium freudenreichii]AWY94987.1 PF06224 family protein [Propionibacterium freudenreichii]